LEPGLLAVGDMPPLFEPQAVVVMVLVVLLPETFPDTPALDLLFDLPSEASKAS